MPRRSPSFHRRLDGAKGRQLTRGDRLRDLLNSGLSNRIIGRGLAGDIEMARRRPQLNAAASTLPPAKDRIMTAAARLYSRYGIQLPLATIANEAQTNIETIQKYYGSHDGLII